MGITLHFVNSLNFLFTSIGCDANECHVLSIQWVIAFKNSTLLKSNTEQTANWVWYNIMNNRPLVNLTERAYATNDTYRS